MRTSPGRAIRRLPWLLPLLLVTPLCAALGESLPTEISGLSISADGSKLLVSMDRDGVLNAYAVPLAGGEPVQLTHSTTDPVEVVSWFPRDGRFLYRSGPVGDDAHLFIHEADGTAVEVSPGKPSRFLGWTAEGDAMLVEIYSAGAQSRDLFQIATDGDERLLVKANTSQLSRLAAVSPNQRYLAYAEVFADQIRNLRILDLASKQQQALKAGEGLMVHIPLVFSPDSQGLLFLNDAARSFRYLALMDSATGARRDLLKKPWDVLDAFYSPNGKLLAAVVGGDASSTLELYDAASLQPIPLPDFPPVTEIGAAAISRDGKTLAFLASASDQPPAVYVYDLAKPGPPRRLIGGGEGAGSKGRWVAGEIVRFPSFDGRSIPGILYKPRQAGPEHKVPAVVWIHDGPSGQARLAFDPLIQSLVQRGYAVYAVNHRGSMGYGKEFARLDDFKHGAEDLGDCIAAKRMLAATGWIDSSRIAVAGTGFGGYLTLAALAFQPREFGAGVDLFGIANWRRVLDSLPPPERAALAEEMGNPEDPLTGRFLVPLEHAGEIARPLLIVQGGKDDQAVSAEAAQIAAAMKTSGRTVELLVLPDEGHGLARRDNRTRVYQAIADFLDRNLKAGGAPRKLAHHSSAR
jgi:dipeptidyl aminopeptidase/acylaminoacyl peptidase